MALITNTGSGTNTPTELGGNYKILSLPNVKMDAATSTLTLSDLNNGLSSIQNVIAVPDSISATFTYVCASFSGLVITLYAKEQDGTDATTFEDVNLLVIGA